MSHNDSRRSKAARRGFSAIELILVVGLSGILLVGLTAMIDMPQQIASKEQSANPSVSSADLALSALDRDIRFATEARTPSATRLELDQNEGGTVVWEYRVVDAELVRIANGRTAKILDDIRAGSFELKYETVVRRVEEAKPVTTAAVTVASFDNFLLKTGYTLLSGVRGLTSVLETTTLKDVDTTNMAGIYLTPGSLGTDRGVPTALRLRLQRAGAGDFVVNIYEADPATKRPIRANRVAEGRLYARQIPVALGDVSVPLAMERKIDPTKSYFVLMRSTSGLSAKIEARTLSLASALEPHPHSFLTTANAGIAWSALTAVLDASQTKFAFEAARVTVDDAAPVDADGLQAGYDAIEVPVAVMVSFLMQTPGGGEPVRAAFILQNKLALVNR